MAQSAAYEIRISGVCWLLLLYDMDWWLYLGVGTIQKLRWLCHALSSISFGALG